MAKVAVPGTLSSNSLPFGRGASKLQAGSTKKRKTPSELREEQLKRRSCAALVDESSTPLLGSEKNTGGMVCGIKKPEASSKNPRYIDTRVDEVYPVRKFIDRFKIPSGKEKAKDTVSSEQTSTQKNPPVDCNLGAKSKPRLQCPESSPVSAASAIEGLVHECQTTERCTQNTFRTVAELSLGNERSSGLANMDMDALKSLGSRDPFTISHSPADSSERFGDLPSVYSGNFSSEFHIPGNKTPLDLSLKTSMRFVSSTSVNWCHRLTTSSYYNGMMQFTSQFSCLGNENVSHLPGFNSTAAVLISKALHSWVYPQSSLPASVISALTLSSSQGEMDFLLKRQLAWKDSFRSLYYMLRRNMCHLFYVCTSQFVVMFTGGDCFGKMKRSCSAYVSQSTKGLRSLLREHDICFSMPLCHSEAEQATAEDLVELSELEKHNLGQRTRQVSSISDIDNTPRSLLEFSGIENVHGLYDFLLNYRSFLVSLTGVDVPVLYSPIPFQNASLSAPEVKCKEMKKANVVPESSQVSSAGVCYSIEIKDTVLPPWIISGVCAAMGSEGRNFDACFTTDTISVGLNVALDTTCQKSDAQTKSSKGMLKSSYTFGLSESIVAPCLRSGPLKALKYSNGSYTASLLPV